MRISDWSSDVCSSDLCTIDETVVSHPFLRQRVANAFEAGLPAAAVIPFGRIVSRDAGAELVTAGSIAAVRQLYEGLVALLAPHGIAPWYRQSGLRPHITLGYGRHRFEQNRRAACRERGGQYV